MNLMDYLLKMGKFQYTSIYFNIKTLPYKLVFWKILTKFSHSKLTFTLNMTSNMCKSLIGPIWLEKITTVFLRRVGFIPKISFLGCLEVP